MTDYPLLLGRLEGSVRAALAVAAVSPGEALRCLTRIGEALKEGYLAQLEHHKEDAFLRTELELLENDLKAIREHMKAGSIGE